MFGGGDVKYHLGFSTDRVTRTGAKMHLSLAFNPSPPRGGRSGRRRTRARQAAAAQRRQVRERVLGVWSTATRRSPGRAGPETLNLTSLRGYRTGGTVHVIVNNQIGFTTTPLESRSTPYATDVAKMHPGARSSTSTATTPRRSRTWCGWRWTTASAFHSDVVIDMYCYRKYGHNEADEPSFTQPLLYQKIERHPSVRTLYAKRAGRAAGDRAGRGGGDRQAASTTSSTMRSRPSARRGRCRRRAPACGGAIAAGSTGRRPRCRPRWSGSCSRRSRRASPRCPTASARTAVVAKLLANRAAMGRGEAPLDWGMAEHARVRLAGYGRAYMVRLSGQDCAARHLQPPPRGRRRPADGAGVRAARARVATAQAPCRIYDSPLSEAAVLGFEFGYSLDYPDALVTWEAQFGDFVNGAQVMIDQFISSAEDKWKRLSGLTCCCCRTATRGRGRSTPRRRFERFLELARRGQHAGRASRRRRRSSSTCCGGR